MIASIPSGFSENLLNFIMIFCIQLSMPLGKALNMEYKIMKFIKTQEMSCKTKKYHNFVDSQSG